MRKDSLAQIAPAATAIGPPSTTARRLINASVSDNTSRYAGAIGQLDAWLAGQTLEDAALAAYLAALHDAGRAADRCPVAPRPRRPPAPPARQQRAQLLDRTSAS